MKIIVQKKGRGLIDKKIIHIKNTKFQARLKLQRLFTPKVKDSNYAQPGKYESV